MNLIREQFSFYEADIVVCCGSGVSKAFQDFIHGPEEGEWRTTRGGVSYLEYMPNKHVISYSGPQVAQKALRWACRCCPGDPTSGGKHCLTNRSDSLLRGPPLGA